MTKFATYTIPSKVLSEAEDLEAIAHEIAVTLADKVTFNLGGAWIVLPHAAEDAVFSYRAMGDRREEFLKDSDLREIGDGLLVSLRILSHQGGGVCVTTPYGSFALFTVGDTARFGGFVYGDGTHLIGNAVILSLVLTKLAQLQTDKMLPTSNNEPPPPSNLSN